MWRRNVSRVRISTQCRMIRNTTNTKHLVNSMCRTKIYTQHIYTSHIPFEKKYTYPLLFRSYTTLHGNHGVDVGNPQEKSNSSLGAANLCETGNTNLREESERTNIKKCFDATKESIEETFFNVIIEGETEKAKLFYEKHKEVLQKYILSNYLFSTFLCQSGYLEMAQWLWEKYPIEIRFAHDSAFRNACANGHLEMAQWLKKICADINICAENNDAFQNACSRGDLRMAKWLFEVEPSIKNYVTRHNIFMLVCRNGHLDFVQWLLEKFGTGVCEDSTMAFRHACASGNLEIVELIVQIYPKTDVRDCNDAAFINACASGNQRLIKWLIKTYPQIDIRVDGDRAFIVACSMGHLGVAKWIKSMYPDIYINKHDANDLFRHACQYGYLDIAKWLLRTFSNIDIREDGDAAFRVALIHSQYKILEFLSSICKDYSVILESGTLRKNQKKDN